MSRVLSSQGIGPQGPVDPTLRGFTPLPYTKALLRFNANGTGWRATAATVCVGGCPIRVTSMWMNR